MSVLEHHIGVTQKSSPVNTADVCTAAKRKYCLIFAREMLFPWGPWCFWNVSSCSVPKGKSCRVVQHPEILEVDTVCFYSTQASENLPLALYDPGMIHTGCTEQHHCKPVASSVRERAAREKNPKAYIITVGLQGRAVPGVWKPCSGCTCNTEKLKWTNDPPINTCQRCTIFSQFTYRRCLSHLVQEHFATMVKAFARAARPTLRAQCWK